MGVGDVEVTTPLYIDMMVATELLHRSHGEFLALSRMERTKLRFFMWAKMAKRKKELNDLKNKTSNTED